MLRLMILGLIRRGRKKSILPSRNNSNPFSLLIFLCNKKTEILLIVSSADDIKFTVKFLLNKNRLKIQFTCCVRGKKVVWRQSLDEQARAVVTSCPRAMCIIHLERCIRCCFSQILTAEKFTKRTPPNVFRPIKSADRESGTDHVDIFVNN
jgi:hypothetical protein